MVSQFHDGHSIAPPTETGTSLVEGLASGRDWSKLTPTDIRRFIDSLHPSAKVSGDKTLESIGGEWDGKTAIDIKGTLVSADSIRRLLDQIDARIRTNGDALEKSGPVTLSVRIGPAESADKDLIVIDVAFPDFVLPISIDQYCELDTAEASAAAAERVADFIASATKSYGQMRDREMRMRRSFRDAVSELGHGAAPLWMGLEPAPIGGGTKGLTRLYYVAIFLILDETLAWAPTGRSLIATMREMRQSVMQYASYHRPRAAALSRLHAAGSEAMLSEVALNFIRRRGLDPIKVARDAIATRRAKRHKGIEYGEGKEMTTLRFEDGVVNATIYFLDGLYTAGELRLFGTFPDTLALSLKGRRLGEVVAHDAFLGSLERIGKVKMSDAYLDLSHRAHVTTVEEAVSRTG